MERLICVAIGYAFGLIQSGYLYGRINHIDIRQHGSGNAGSTNVLRVMGTKAGAVVFLGDFFKAVAAICLVRVLFASGSDSVDLLALYAGLGVTLGHNFPFYLRFKGGRDRLHGRDYDGDGFQDYPHLLRGFCRRGGCDQICVSRIHFGIHNLFRGTDYFRQDGKLQGSRPQPA